MFNLLPCFPAVQAPTTQPPTTSVPSTPGPTVPPTIPTTTDPATTDPTMFVLPTATIPTTTVYPTTTLPTTTVTGTNGLPVQDSSPIAPIKMATQPASLGTTQSSLNAVVILVSAAVGAIVTLVVIAVFLLVKRRLRHGKTSWTFAIDISKLMFCFECFLAPNPSMSVGVVANSKTRPLSRSQ